MDGADDAESRPHETEEEGVAILSRLPLHEIAVWPLPPSEPPRHRLEATIARPDGRLTLTTLHAAVSSAHVRDAQIATLAQLGERPLLVGVDLNAPAAVVRPLLADRLLDTLDWDETPTWPVDAGEFARAWENKLGEKPRGEPAPRRLDYLLVHGLGRQRIRNRDARRRQAQRLRPPSRMGRPRDPEVSWPPIRRPNNLAR